MLQDVITGLHQDKLALFLWVQSLAMIDLAYVFDCCFIAFGVWDIIVLKEALTLMAKVFESLYKCQAESQRKRK